MHIGKSYSLPEFLAWTRRRIYVLLLLALLPVAAYQLLGLHWLALPWPVAALLGTAASFIVGFKNAQTYNRTIEAQQVWTSITTLTRYWALLCRDFPKTEGTARPLLARHLAWLTALRYQARTPRIWETANAASNAEFRRRNFQVPELELSEQEALRRHLPPQELAALAGVADKTGWLLAAQSKDLRDLYVAQELVVLHHTEMQKTLKELIDQQAKVERIKNFPYPRQYAAINRIFVWTFAAVLPLCLVREFDRLNEVVAAPWAGHMAWLAVPFAVLVAWLYLALDQVGESTENPFEGGANDVPMARVCAMLEGEVRVLLGEGQPAAAVPAEQRIIL